MAKAIPIQVTQTGFEQSIQAGAKAAGQINIPVNATFNAGSFNNLAQPLGKVTGLATEFEKSIAASNARVIAFGASVGIINGIQNAFKSLVDTTIEVQKSLAQIGAVSGKSGEELSRFGDNLFDIAKNTGQSFKVASEAAIEFSRQNLSLQETLSRTNDALTLARFTSLSVADAVDVLTAAVNSFGSAGLTTSEILNKLVAVDSEFAVSAADLANGLSRAGSIAQDVGVSFDELNGIITAVQEKTARGGAVIGNAFKSIFTRIRSEDTIQALQKIGISSVDAAGNLKPVVPILKELASTLNTLSGTEKIQALEAVGSKYNINILNALLQDLNSAESQFDKSKTTSSNASSEAYQRQIELNKSLDAIINNVSVSVDKLANSIGRIGVSDNLKGLLNFFGDLVSSINGVIDSEGIGGNIAKGLISGLGGVFFKVGVPLLVGLFTVLTKNIIQFGAESLQTILGLNSKVKEREALEQAVFNTLVRNQGIMENMDALAGDRARQEQFLLKVYNDQFTALKKVQDLSVSIAPALQAAGLSATSGQLKKKASGGYLPAQEAADVSRGVGGASASSKVVSIPNFAFGGGKKGTMIANTSEYIVPNYANGGSAIFNQDMIKSFGLPAGAKKINAAGGFVPNFAVNKKDPYKMLEMKPTYGASKRKMVEGVNFERRVLKFISAPPTGSSTLDIPPDLTNRIEAVKKQEIGMQGDYGDVKMTYSKDNQNSMLAKLISFHGLSSSVIEATKKSQPQFDLNSKQPQISNSTLFYKGDPSVFKKTLISATLGQVLKAGKQDDTLLSSFDEIRSNPGQKKSAGLKENYSSMKVLANVNADEILDPQTSASRGYIPNFADPLKDAVKREMEAGLDPSQIRITKDARLKSGSNPEGFAVINTRDEPDGKIPNFADNKPTQGSGMFGGNRQDKRGALKTLDSIAVQQKQVSSSDILNNSQNRLAKEIDAAIGSYKNGIINQNNLIEMVKFLAADYKLSASAQKKLTASTEDFASKIKLSPAVNIKNMPFPSLQGVPVTKGAEKQPTQGKEGGAEKEGLGFGKFLALQSALVLATEATKSFAEEGSTTAKATEAVGSTLSGGLAGWSTFSSLAPALGPVGAAVLGVGSAALIAGPAIAKLIPENEGQKILDQLKELGDQAEKTGEQLTPEKILASFESNAVKTSNKKANSKLEEQVLAQANKMNIASSESGFFSPVQELQTKELKDIITVLKASGGIQGDKIDQKMLSDLLSKSTENKSYYAGESGEKLDYKGFQGVAFKGAASELLKGKSGKSKNRASENLIVQESNEIANIQRREAALSAQSAEELKINASYQNRILYLDKISEKLKNNSALLTQEEKISKELSVAKERINAEAEKENKLNLINVKSSLQKFREEGVLLRSGTFKVNPQEKFKESNPLGIPSTGDFAYKSKKLPAFSDIGSGYISPLNDSSTKELLKSISAGTGQQAAEKLIPGFSGTSSESQKKVLDELRKAADALQKNDIETAYKLTKEALNKQQTESEKNTETLRGLNEIISGSIVGQKLYAEQVNLAAQKYEIDGKSKALAERFQIENMAKNAKVDDELTAFKKVTLEQYKTSYSEEVKKANIAKKLADAEFDLVKSENDKNENNKVDIGLTRQRFGAERNEIRRKIAIQDAYNSQISQLALDQKVADELRLEKSSLIDATKKLTARYNNLAGEKENEKARTSNQLDSDILSKLTKGSVYSGTSVNLKEQATASVLEQNLAGRKPEDISIAEKTNLLSGKGNSIKQNLRIEGSGLLDEARTFQQILGQDTPKALADGLAEAMKVGLSGADDIGESLQNIAKSFLQNLQGAFLQSASNKIVGSTLAAIGGSKGGYVRKFANGGMVTGGSGIRDDVPAMLSAGEYVMRKSAVQKYGAENIAKMNDGGIFLPGVRGGSAISGYDQLSKFANQTTTSGATDVLKGTGSTAFANLEDQSARLSRFGLMNEDTIKGEVTSAQQQGLDLISKREAYRTQQRKAMQQQVISTLAAAGLSYGVGKIGDIANQMTVKSNVIPGQTMMTPYRVKGADGGMVARFANGGGPTDDIPALLMGGEYVMNRASVRKYGKQYLDSMNTGRARFADGGEVGGDATVESSDSKAKVDSKTGTAVNININVSGSGSSTESQGQTSQGGVDYKKMGERIKAVVLETINEEKRLGGALRSR